MILSFAKRNELNKQLGPLMTRRAWLTSLYQRLAFSQTRASTRRQRSMEIATASLIERLEPRQLLTTGLVIHPAWDDTITKDTKNSATIEATINQVISQYEASFTDPITVNITFKEDLTIGLAQSLSSTFWNINLSTFMADLSTGQSTAYDATAMTTLTNSTKGFKANTAVDVTNANMKALDSSAATLSSDGTISLNTSVCNLDRTTIDTKKYDLASTVAHEIDEILGLGVAVDPKLPIRVQNLFRYDASGNLVFGSSSTVQTYFSLNGVSPIIPFNNGAGNTDYGDWASTSTPHVQDAYGITGVIVDPNIEFIALDVQGYHYVIRPIDITLSQATIPEHSPTGKIVGSLKTLEPNSSSTFNYSLVTGAGDTDNSRFSIDAMGNLVTNQVLDLATQSSYSVRVRTTDQSLNTYEKTFTISLLPSHATRTLTVDSSSDTPVSGFTTLREAIATANSDSPGDTITFGGGLTGKTIVLTQGEIPITNSMTIVAPLFANITISGNNASRIFNIDDSNPTVKEKVAIVNLTLVHGNAVGSATTTQSGGALINSEQLSISFDTLSGNTASGGGGGIENLGLLFSSGDTFSGNSAGGMVAESTTEALSSAATIPLLETWRPAMVAESRILLGRYSPRTIPSPAIRRLWAVPALQMFPVDGTR